MNLFASPADVVHLHLLLNHVPTVGAVMATGLFLLARARRGDDLTRVSLELFFLVALATLPAYVTGAAAHEVLKGRADLSEVTIAAHQNAALLAFLCMEVTGAVAWFALWQFRRVARMPHGTLVAVLVLSMVTLVVMTHAATLGGAVRHSEILPASATAGATDPGQSWIDASALGEFLISHLWVWPTGEILHFIGMALSFGVLLVVNLHLLGFMKHVPFAAVHRLLPWGMLGVGLNVVTGMLFFTGVTPQFTENPAFHWKVMLLVPAGLSYLYLTVADRAWMRVPGGRASLADKVIAGSSVFLWVSVLYLGRMLPYLRGTF